MKELYLMKSVSGCGKSHEALRLAGGDRSKIFSADDFFGPDYNFDENQLYPAHKDCQRRAAKAMAAGITPVIIDNTNLRIREVIPYVVEGFWYDYHMEIVEPKSLWWLKVVKPACISKEEMAVMRAAEILVEKNVHKVPYSVIVKMINRWQDYTISMVLDRIFGPDHGLDC